ncbi:S1 family peptidase [Streptomyces sp. NPDC060198]|uniref:S1 family peptidase n=1 Tax=Streptomyces sp. NPDC060198 TaxID=3347070 RepID=UPI003655A346
MHITKLGAIKFATLVLFVAGVSVGTPSAQAQTPVPGTGRDVAVAGGPSGKVTQALVEELSDSRTAGLYLDPGTKRIVVNVTDGESAEAVAEAGATPRRVAYDTAYLNSIKELLDQTFRTPGTMWGVDVTLNQVVVRADSTVSDADFQTLSAFIQPYGDAAKIDRVTGENEETASSSINGGDFISNGYHYCSYGFSVRSKTDSNDISFLTAGHCTTSPGTDWTKSDGTYIGYTTGHNYSNGNDFGLIRAYNRDDVTYYGNVTAAGGVAQDISYSRDSVILEDVCASGYNSKYACGPMRQKNQTINYSDHQVTGMDVAEICRAGGDSGGPLFFGTAALGILSGRNTGSCLSYYQPVNEALAWYGVEVF